MLAPSGGKDYFSWGMDSRGGPHGSQEAPPSRLWFANLLCVALSSTLNLSDASMTVLGA